MYYTTAKVALTKTAPEGLTLDFDDVILPVETAAVICVLVFQEVIVLTGQAQVDWTCQQRMNKWLSQPPLHSTESCCANSVIYRLKKSDNLKEVTWCKKRSQGCCLSRQPSVCAKMATTQKKLLANLTSPEILFVWHKNAGRFFGRTIHSEKNEEKKQKKNGVAVSSTPSTDLSSAPGSSHCAAHSHSRWHCRTSLPDTHPSGASPFRGCENFCRSSWAGSPCS